jgi:hypothetical protein
MTVQDRLGRGIEKQLITAIVAAGKGKPLLEKYKETAGVLSISRHHARGAGRERIKTGQLFFTEMDVLMLLVDAEFADQLFSDLFSDAEIGRPGGGMIFSEMVLQGHPMLPVGGTDG